MSILAALESIENGASVDTNAVAQAETATEVAEELAEVNELSEPIVEDTTSIETAVQADSELTEIAEVAADAVESGEGLSEDAAAIATVAIEKIHDRLYGRRDMGQKIVPGLESFGQTNTRLYSTKMILEGIGEFLEKIWRGIKAMAARIWDRVVQFLAKIFGSTKALDKHLQNLRNRVRDLSPSAKLSEKNLKSEKLARSIGFLKEEAGVDTYQRLVKNANGLVKVGNDIAKARIKLSADLQSSFAANFEKGYDEAALATLISETGKVNKDIANIVIAAIPSATGSGGIEVADLELPKKEGKDKQDSKITFYGPFTGGDVLLVELEQDMDLKEVNIYISFRSVRSKDQAKKAKALDRTEMLKVLDIAQTSLDSITDFKSVEKSLGGVNKEIQDLSDKIISSVKKSVKEANGKSENNRAMAELKRNAEEATKTVSIIGERASVILVNTVQAGLNYVSASLANMK
jgi:hypothetical protein